jgi:carboxymethylenebutenolidase
MCVPLNAEIPDLPLSGPMPTGQRGLITAEDGGRNAAYAVTPDTANGTGILILPDVRGLFHFYERLACAAGAEGRYALAIDYFGRKAGLDTRGGDWDSWEDNMDATSPEQLTMDLRAGLARLREMGAERNYILGFCFGGGTIFRNVDQGLDAVGMMAIYGVAREWRQFPDAYGNLSRATHPVAALFGGADQVVPAEEATAIEAALDHSGAPHEVHVYPGAPHSFFNEHFTEYAQECRDVWRRLLALTAA